MELGNKFTSQEPTLACDGANAIRAKGQGVTRILLFSRTGFCWCDTYTLLEVFDALSEDPERGA